MVGQNERGTKTESTAEIAIDHADGPSGSPLWTYRFPNLRCECDFLHWLIEPRCRAEQALP